MSFGFVLYAAIQLDPLSSKNRKRQILWYHENTNGCFCQLAPCAFVFSFRSPHHVLFLTWILVQSVLKQAVTQHQLVVDVRVNLYRVSIQGDEEGGAWCKYHTITILPYFARKFFSSSIQCWSFLLSTASLIHIKRADDHFLICLQYQDVSP